MSKEDRSGDEAMEGNRSQREVSLVGLRVFPLPVCLQAGLIKHLRAQGSEEH